MRPLRSVSTLTAVTLPELAPAQAPPPKSTLPAWAGVLIGVLVFAILGLGALVIRNAVVGAKPAAVTTAPRAVVISASPTRAVMDERSACVAIVGPVGDGVSAILDAANAGDVATLDRRKLDSAIQRLDPISGALPEPLRSDVLAQLGVFVEVQRAVTGNRPPAFSTDRFTATVQSIARRCAVYATAAAPSSAPPQPGTIAGDGTLLVGSQVQPGQYRATAPVTGHCYWQRMKSTTGTLDDVIANDNVDPGAQAIVTIAPTDKAFQTNGCGEWRKIG